MPLAYPAIPPLRRIAAPLDAAVVVAGLAATTLPLTPPDWRRLVVLVGLAAATLLFAAGLLPLARPVVQPEPRWPHRAVDLAGPTIGLVLAAWVLLPTTGLGPPTRFAAAVALGGLAMAALVALTGPDRGSGAARCRGGAALTLFALVLLATLVAAALPDRALLAAVPPLAGGALLTAAGSRRLVPAGVPQARRPGAGRLPRLLLPALVAMVAVGWRLATGGAIDGTTVAMAMAMVPALVLRELLPTRPGRPADALGSQRDAEATPGFPLDDAELLRALADSPPVASAGALLLVDLHGVGSPGGRLPAEVAVEVARRVRAVVDVEDRVTGLSAGGLAVITRSGSVQSYALGGQLVAVLGQPYDGPVGVWRLQVSIGLAETDGVAPEDVLRRAGLARRRAVQLGRDRVEWYDAYLEEQLVRRLDLERELPGAVARNELDLVYQPIVGLADRQPVGTEALLRWRSPVLGTVLPGELVPVAEELGLVGELGCWVLDRACRQLAAWSDTGRDDLWMAVNVTVRELTGPDFVPRVAAVLGAYGVAPERLVIEISEPRVAADLSAVVARLAGLRSLGIRTALDNFRAEHASLSQLGRLPIDLLKVGPQVVEPGAHRQRPLIDVVVTVGNRLGLEIVAGELEWPDQVDGARRAGCRYGQGYALARPATAERVEAYLEEFPSTPR